MELFYNPDALSEKRIKHTFVGRQWLLDELTTSLRQQPDGAGVQHILLVAPRGMGKTTMFLMLGYAVAETELKDKWQVVRFREESYNITDTAEFWMEALRQLRDPELTPSMEQAIAEYRKSADLEAAAVALMKDWVRTHGKRLLLLVENFDGILAQINSEQENSRLRNTLMNDGSVMLIGAATSFFEEARGYEKPLYNFFKVYNLEALTPEEIEELLIRRAELDGKEGLREKIKQNSGQIRALARFTGGNPRLILMLYAVVANAELTEIRTGLEKLLDEVTPYFKARVELLPAQQRKILDQIARESVRTMDGQSPSAIAKAIRTTPNQVSAQLKRMAEGGYVRSVSARGRVAYYTLSEALFALWYQMRFGRDARERMNWLVSFLRVWYDDAELHNETKLLCQRLAEMVSAGRQGMTQDALEYGTFLVDAIRDRAARTSGLATLIVGYATAGEVEKACAMLNEKLDSELTDAERADVHMLRFSLRDSQGLKGPALSDLEEGMRLNPTYQSFFDCRRWQAGLLLQHNRWQEALDASDCALALAREPEEKIAVQRIRGTALLELGRLVEWQQANLEILGLLPNDPQATVECGFASLLNGDIPGAEDRFRTAARTAPEEDVQRCIALVLLFNISCGRADYTRALAQWRALPAIPFAKIGGPLVMRILLLLVQNGHARFLLETISESAWREPLAPFLRALEYIETGNRDLIEKLSPEVRTVVEDLVTQIQEKRAGTSVPAL